MGDAPVPEHRDGPETDGGEQSPAPPSSDRRSRPILPSESRTPVHTIFICNLDFRVTYDEIYRFCERFGPIKAMFYPLTKPGMALCTYFDLRDAERAVKEGMGCQVHGRSVKTNFGFKPPAHANRNLKEICACILARSTSVPSKISFPEMRKVLAAFGDVRTAEQREEGVVVKFYDLRAAEKCDQEKWVTIKGEKVTLAYLETEDLGDEMESPAPPPRRHARRAPQFPHARAEYPPMPQYPPGYPYASQWIDPRAYYQWEGGAYARAEAPEWPPPPPTGD
jgi:RNA recognition motif-containing protein